MHQPQLQRSASSKHSQQMESLERLQKSRSPSPVKVTDERDLPLIKRISPLGPLFDSDAIKKAKGYTEEFNARLQKSKIAIEHLLSQAQPIAPKAII